MDIHECLSPTDAKTAAGWLNPRAYMTDTAAIAARVAEDGRRIAQEQGSCTDDDLTRLGWLDHQVALARSTIRRQVDALQEVVNDHLAREQRRCAEPAPPIPFEPRPATLDDTDIAFGIERAA